MHLQESEESLQDRVREKNISNTFLFNSGVHGNLQSVKNQSGQSEYYFFFFEKWLIWLLSIRDHRK